MIPLLIVIIQAKRFLNFKIKILKIICTQDIGCIVNNYREVLEYFKV